MADAQAAIEIRDVSFHYGERRALNNVAFDVQPGELFALVGPNGGGKTTLFRLLATLVPLQQGTIRILGYDVAHQPNEVRARIGVVFQAPSVDKKLTVRENLRHQGHLYGLSGRTLRAREDEMLGELGLSDRASDLVEKLSGGLRRRVELAKGLLHRPQVVLLDEPSTGLDPGARSDLWSYLVRLQHDFGVSVLLTTHLLEEAEKADRVAIIDQGAVVAIDTPEALKATVGGDTISIEVENPKQLASAIHEQFELHATVVDGTVRLELPEAHRWVARLIEAFPGQIRSITLSQPTLEDVFISRTGHRFWAEGVEVEKNNG